MATAVLEMTGISKRFGTVVANDGVDLTLHGGEILALLGENGAGKTTLMNILFGHYSPDAGRVLVDGRELNLGSPRAAVQAGIAMVHQHFALVDNHTVLENVLVGRERLVRPRQDRSAALEKLRALMEEYDLPADPDARVGALSVGGRQRLEVLKALYGDARILILDEPTAVLTPQETEGLFRFLRRFVEGGNSVIFISHKLSETIAVSDRVQVLRRGRSVMTVETARTTVSELAEVMVGRPVQRLSRPSATPGGPLLELRDVTVESGHERLRDVSLEVRAGEIVGVAGVAGNGQQALFDVAAGLAEPAAGAVRLGGRDVTRFHPLEFVRRGVARIPEDRLGAGLKPDRPIWENLVVYDYRRHTRLGLLDRAAIRRRSESLMAEYGVDAPGWRAETRNLSGGNLQKLILARELSRTHSLIVASQPTRGLDVGAIEDVYRNLLGARSAGTGTLLISEDLDEILTLSDRIVVLYEGRVVASLPGDEATPRTLGLLMAGKRVEEEALVE